MTSQCSAPITVETRNLLDQPTPVLSDTTVFLTGAPSVLSFFASSGCLGGAASSLLIPAGQSQLRFWVRTSFTGTITMTTTSPPLSAASQPVVFTQVPPILVLSASVPSPLRAGACLPALVEARTLGMLVLPTDTPVSLTTNVANGSLFFSDTSCTAPVTSVTIRAGTSQASLSVKPVSGVPQVLTATAPFDSGTLSLSPVPIVRRGTCTVQGSNELCAIEATANPASATLGRSFLITQSISSAGTLSPLDVEARCRLQGNATFNCTRRGGGGPGSGGDALTHFQVVELPVGLSVLASSNSLCSTTTIPLSGMLDPARSFVLKSVVGTGTNFGQDDSVTATLSGPSTVTLSSTTCEGYDVQAIQWDGVTVTRGVSAIPSGLLFTTPPMLTPSSPATLVLGQPSNDVVMTVSPCQFLGRAELTSPSELRFSRGANRATCTVSALPRIAWERIDFGSRARVWPYTSTLTLNTQSLSVPITTVDPTRSFVITSSQQLGGQGSGESDALGSADVVDAAVQTILVSASPTTATSVNVVRQASNSALIVTFYVVQIDP